MKASLEKNWRLWQHSARIPNGDNWLELLVAASLRRGIVSESVTVPTSFYCLPALDSFVLQVQYTRPLSLWSWSIL